MAESEGRARPVPLGDRFQTPSGQQRRAGLGRGRATMVTRRRVLVKPVQLLGRPPTMVGLRGLYALAVDPSLLASCVLSTT